MFCYCGSAQDFAICCLPFIEGQQKPTTPEQLMRSRYSAYCVANIHYIHQTYHPDKQAENPLAEIAAFAASAHFIGLTVLPAPDIQQLNKKNGQFLPPQTTLLAEVPQKISAEILVETTTAPVDDAVGYVHFIARFIQQDKLQQLEEISRFVWQQQQWWYLDGRLLPLSAGKINRNDSCPCGSGKKYKVCLPHQLSGQNQGDNSTN